MVHRKTRANVNNLGRGHAGRQPSGKIFLEDGPHRVCYARRIPSPRRVGTLTGKKCVNRPLALGRNGQVVVLMEVGLGPRGGFFLAVVLTPPTRRAALLCAATTREVEPPLVSNVSAMRCDILAREDAASLQLLGSFGSAVDPLTMSGASAERPRMCKQSASRTLA